MVGLKTTSQIPAFRRTLQREMADYQERVAERIVKAREAIGFDREPFALRAGISPKQLARIEAGKSNPRAATVRKIAEAAGVAITDLRPDLDEEEQRIRAQLDRIEEKLDEVLRRLRRYEPDEGAGLPPVELPPDPGPPPDTRDADERPSEAAG